MLRGSLVSVQLPSKPDQALQGEAVLSGGRSLTLCLLPHVSQDTSAPPAQLSMTHTFTFPWQHKTPNIWNLDISDSHQPTTTLTNHMCVVEFPTCAKAPGPKNLRCVMCIVIVQARAESKRRRENISWKTLWWQQPPAGLGGGSNTWAVRKRGDRNYHTLSVSSLAVVTDISAPLGTRGRETFPLSWVWLR